MIGKSFNFLYFEKYFMIIKFKYWLLFVRNKLLFLCILVVCWYLDNYKKSKKICF